MGSLKPLFLFFCHIVYTVIRLLGYLNLLTMYLSGPFISISKACKTNSSYKCLNIITIEAIYQDIFNSNQ